MKLSKFYLDQLTPEDKLQRAGKIGKIHRNEGELNGYYCYGVKFRVPLVPNTKFNYLRQLAEPYLRRV